MTRPSSFEGNIPHPTDVSTGEIPRDRCSVCVVLPAYNEAGRISSVLDTLMQVEILDEIIVVDDGSVDGTSEVVKKHPIAATDRFRLLRHEPNRGKGATMRAGAMASCATILIFFDADLIGLKPEHVVNIMQPVAEGKVKMALGVFRNGRGATDIGQILSPNITGQRAILREVFLKIPNLDKAGYGVEMAITQYILDQRMPFVRVILPGITHTMKEEKLGWIRGFTSRLRMYWQMTPYLFIRVYRRLRGK